MNIEFIVVTIVILSFLLILIPESKPPKIKEWYYNPKNHIMCIITKDKGIQDLYFMYINGFWYTYPNGVIASRYWSDVCNNLLKSRKPM